MPNVEITGVGDRARVKNKRPRSIQWKNQWSARSERDVVGTVFGGNGFFALIRTQNKRENYYTKREKVFHFLGEKKHSDRRRKPYRSRTQISLP